MVFITCLAEAKNHLSLISLFDLSTLVNCVDHSLQETHSLPCSVHVCPYHQPLFLLVPRFTWSRRLLYVGASLLFQDVYSYATVSLGHLLHSPDFSCWILKEYLQTLFSICLFESFIQPKISCAVFFLIKCFSSFIYIRK